MLESVWLLLISSRALLGPLLRPLIFSVRLIVFSRRSSV
jgi:hypothetical protein